ncbi:glycoside hydrolase [Pisolithus croceorrhizus]|nr:glycoside hydrolase [Pisolithus croceorrhizus]
MGDDEYHPISQKGTNLTAAGGIGYTVIDSIDTMLIMGLHDEYERARIWVRDDLSFDRNASFSTFETTIRVMGGLLSAYHLLPLPLVNLHLLEGVSDHDNGDFISTAEVSTLQLEFRYLTYLTDEEIYWEKVEKVMLVLKAAALPHGLAPIFVDVETGIYGLSPIRLGSRGDSYYEYLLKQYLQTNQTEDIYREMYDEAMTGIHMYLVQRSVPGNLLTTAELIPDRAKNGKAGWRLLPKQDHLVCFLGGSLMLGATTSGAVVNQVSVPPLPNELSPQGRRDWFTGPIAAAAGVCSTDPSKLPPEIAYFSLRNQKQDKNAARKLPPDWYIKAPGKPTPLDARYILRPETVESLFIAFRLTGDTWYRDQGWAIFQAIEKHCRIPTGGYASVINVDQMPVEHEDKMETFMMSETLKYLYLLFSDASVLPLSEYVFNTEGHPLPIFLPIAGSSSLL